MQKKNWTEEPDNRLFAVAAREALDDPGYEGRPGQCWRFVRQLIDREYRMKGIRPMLGFNAAQALKWYKKTTYYRGEKPILRVGDLVFKSPEKSGRAGHVGIYIGNGQIAENSTYHSARGEDAKGIRSLAEFGEYDGVVRLPALRKR